ncbi:hypothetical protein [Dactylosporangium sp. NPDC051541]|uniref:hypothetical protein n=1 Tax=Dactylosporangium sp. NPDC051541 TaxID=3363977 RepID=UPI0037AB8EC8
MAFVVAVLCAPAGMRLISDFARLVSLGGAHGGLIFVLAHWFPRTASGLVRLGDALDVLLASKQLPGRDRISWPASHQ